MLRRFSACSLLCSLSLIFAACSSLPKLNPNERLYIATINEFSKPEQSNIDQKEYAENVNGIFPDEVYVKSLSQTFLKDWQFILSDGKIYAKQSGEDRWRLFMKTGKPKGSQEISEIFADGDCLFAFDNQRRLYKLYTEKTTVDKPFKWVNHFGWPGDEQLVQNSLVSENRGWAMGVRRKDVLWYEDVFANQHHYGTMGLETIYFLSADGQKIYFTDSGLPNDFSKQIQGPEHGAFIARSIGCSASTLFLIGDDGTMYTRLIDFDTMGCDPMFFKYTYVKEEQKRKGSEYLSNYAAWGLPNEAWKKEPEIRLFGEARLSRFISIQQNGQGNFARELRVAGTDSEGNTGYYYKQISESEWQFKAVPLQIRQADYLSGDSSRGQKTEFEYSGYAMIDAKREQFVSAAVRDFSLTNEGAFNLEITMQRDGWSETKSLKMHNVELWTYMTRINPGFDGTARYYFITPDFDETLFECAHDEFADFLKSVFEQSDKKLFVFQAEATVDYLQINGKAQSGKKKSFSFFLSSSRINADSQTFKAISFYSSYMNVLYADERIILTRKEVYTNGDVEEIREKVERNKDLKALLKGEMAYYKRIKRSSNISRWGYNLLDLISTITLLNQVNFPKIKTMTSYGGRLMKTNARKFSDIYEYRTMTNPHMVALIDARIDAYEELADQIEKNGKGILSPKQKDTYPELFEFVKLPDELVGTGSTPETEALFCILSEIPVYSAFIIQSESQDKSSVIAAVCEDAAKVISKRDAKLNTYSNLAKKPLTLKLNFIPLITDTADLKHKKGKLTWDGNNLTIVSTTGIGKRILFQGTITAEPQ